MIPGLGSEPRILYIIGQLARGGAEQQFYYLLKYARPDARVVVLRSGDYWAQPIRELGYEVTELNRRGRADFSRLWKLVKIIRQYHPDIIHIFMDNLYGLYGRLAALLTRHSCLLVGERNHPTYDPRWYIFLRRYLLNYAVRAVIANSRCAQEYLIRSMALPQHKALFIPNGLEIGRIWEESRSAVSLPESWQSQCIIGTVGHLSWRKSPERFVSAAAKVNQAAPNTRFLHVGDGELRPNIEHLRDKLNLAEVLQLAGDQRDVPRWLAAMDIFVLTSQSEGMPNAIMEAMAVGLPCVVTDTGDCRDLVADGQTGFVVPVGDQAALVDRILRLVGDAELRQRMGAAGRERITAYDVSRMAAQYQDLYKTLMHPQ